MKDIFLGFLVKTYNLTNEQAAELLYKKGEDGTVTDELNDDVQSTLLNLDAERVKSLKVDPKKYRDEGYQRAQREVSEKIEADIKKTFGITEPLTGAELITAAFTSAKSTELPAEEKVKRSPLYIQLEKQLQDERARLEKEKEDAINGVKNEIKRTQTLSEAKGKAREFLMSLNPVLPVSETAKERQITTFLSNLDRYGFEVDTKGNIVALIDGENRKEDVHGHPYDLNRFVKEEAEQFFGLQAQSQREGGQNRNQPEPPKNGGYNGAVPKDRNEFETAYFALTDPEQRTALTKAFSESQANN